MLKTEDRDASISFEFITNVKTYYRDAPPPPSSFWFTKVLKTNDRDAQCRQISDHVIRTNL